MQQHLQQTIAEIKEAGLYKNERLIESPQQAAIQVAGKEVLNFCANNYLGLSNNPRLIQAAKDMMDNKIIDKIIAEPENLCENNIDTVVAQLKEGISGFIGSNEGFDGEQLAQKRYERYRRY